MNVQAIVAQLYAIRSQVDSLLIQLTGAEELPDGPWSRCDHKNRMELTTMGDEVRSFTCPDCGLSWQQPYEAGPDTTKEARSAQ